MNILMGVNVFIASSIIIYLKEMFDILDDNTSFNNISSFPTNRSASMNKAPRKQNRPSIFKQTKHNNNSSQFDDLINGFLEKQSKVNSSRQFLSPVTTNRGKFDSTDLNFDDIQKTRQTPKNISTSINYTGPLPSKNNNPLDHHKENNLNTHFGKTQQTIFNPSKIEDSFVSSRHMKPPIKKRESLNQNIFASEIGMAIPQQDPTISNSSHQYPKRSIHRRSSIDARSQFNMQDDFTQKNGMLQQSAAYFDKVKQQPLDKMSNTESHIIGWGSKGKSVGLSYLANKDQHGKGMKDKNQPQNKKIFDQKEINERIHNSNKIIIADYQNQISLLKASYQKQIDFLQSHLDQQIDESKSLRQKFLKETSKLIDQQRSRSKRLHDQEISSIKDMFEWQKKKVTQTLRCQIQSLKSVADYRNEMFSNQKSSNDRLNLSDKENRLKLLQSSLDDKSKMLERRQNDLAQKISQLNIEKRLQDEKIRRQEKRLMEMEMSIKKQLFQNKKQISDDKHQMSTQIGNLQLDLIKAREINEIERRQNQMERESLEKEKESVRKTSFQIMQTHKRNMEEVQAEKQRLSELQLELLKKIRIVQLKAKQIHINRNNEQEYHCIVHKEPSKREIEREQPIRPLSRESNAKSMSNLLKTKQRFYEVQQNSRNKLNISVRDHRKLDLGRYISRVQLFAKNKQ